VLKSRILTALVLVPLALLVIFALPPTGFLTVVGLILLLGTMEYRRLAGLKDIKAGHWLLLIQALIFGGLMLSGRAWEGLSGLLLAVSCTLWLLMFLRLLSYEAGAAVNRRYKINSFLTALASVSTGWYALGWLRLQPGGSWLILVLFLIVWATDTGAYFAGKAWGKKKLAPLISPGKTVAGLVGGLVAAVLVGIAAGTWLPMPARDPLALAGLALLTAVASVGGDLLISMHKRTSGCKDSSRLLPGHGGILDRLDSLLAAAPFFALGLKTVVA
jgi:phosphatidate cytidylyltransferase